MRNAKSSTDNGLRNSVGALIRERRLARRMTLQRLADEVGCAKSYLWMIERGTRPPGDGLLLKVEGALGFEAGRLTSAARMARVAQVLGPAGSLDGAWKSGELRRLIDRIGGGEGRESTKYKVQSSKRAEGRSHGLPAVEGREGVEEGAAGQAVAPMRFGLEVPLINRVAAGYPRSFTDLGYPVRVADEYVRCPDLDDADAFAARVVGDSMLPEYREGDIVVFSPARPVTSGMDCFVRTEPDHESTFKRVYFEGRDEGTERRRDEAGRQLIRLQPLNPAYPARVLEREQVAGLYAAVSVMRKI
jgi:repressor LexA